MLKESWEASKRSTESVVSYLLTIQERLKKLCDIVHENLEDAQAMQKTWYDRHSRDRELNPGDEVLILLPTSTNKLLASWRGPYPIVRRVSRVNYEVEMTDRRKKKCIFHINMLRQWHPPCALSLLADEISGEADGATDEDVILWDPRTETAGTPMINEDLTTDQQEDSFLNLTTCYETSPGGPIRLNIASERKQLRSDCPLTGYRTRTAIR